MRFDPAKAITFDLEKGLVHLEGAPARVLVPADALGALCAAAGLEATAAFGRELGAAMGRRVAGRLVDLAGATGSAEPREEAAARGVGAAPVETLVEHLGGELALAGLGTLGIERWGYALVIVLDGCPLGPDAERLLEAVLEGALSAASGGAARALRIDRAQALMRFLIASDAAVDRSRAWLTGGASWGDALVRLHDPPHEQAPASSRQPKPRHEPEVEESFADLLGEEEPPPESGEVASQRKPASTRGEVALEDWEQPAPVELPEPDVIRRPLLQGEAARFLEATRAARPATFGELLDLSLSLWREP